MSHINPGLISAYNSLTDKHLTGYFNNTRIRRHLQRVGLISRSGRIVPDKEYRHKLIQRAHQRHVRECLAQAIFHKVLEMERLHQIEIKRKLEEFSRRERVHKIKVDRSKRYEEEVIHILSPRPPTGPRGVRAQHSGPEGENSESSDSPGSSRPNTAPGKMQRPVRLKPIHSNSTTASHRRSSPYRPHESSNETERPFNCTMDKESRRRLTTTEFSRGISPYRLPVINNFVTPVPPPTKRKDRGPKGTPNSSLRGRRLRPTTAPTGPDINEESPMLRTSVHQSGVCVHMVFYGKTVHLSYDMMDMSDEVKVFQQHCGGENLCVYKGKLSEGETFRFVSRRHRGFPFSLTFFLNGLQVERLSSCCEFKHRRGSRLGGRHGHFGFSSVEGASPCYKCIIAMGLDKKPTPPPKRVKEDVGGEATVISPTETTKDAAEMEGEGTGTTHPQDMETEVQQDIPPEEDKARDDYEEDFEADDEGPAEDGVANDNKTPPSSRKREGEDRARDASDSEEDDKDEDRRSRSPSSSSGSDREDSEAEADAKENQAADGPKEPEEDACQVDRKETPVPPAGTDKPTAEDARAAESDSPAVPQTTTSTATKEPGAPDRPGDSAGSTELEVSDTGVPSGNEGKGDGDTSGAKEENKADKTSDESPQEEELERAKSVQEKLVEAILKEAQCSSEPELSDTSTEEEEESTYTGQQQDSKDTVPKKSVTFPQQQQTHVEEVKCEESAAVAGDAVEGQVEETSEQKEKEDETATELNESAMKVVIDELEKNEDVEKAASELDTKEDTGERNESEVKEEADSSLHPESEKMAEDKVSEPQGDQPEKSTDAEVAEKELEEEKTPEDQGTKPDETEQDPEETKRIKEDESSTPELRNKTGETTALDNAEEEVTASEVAEMKVEPTAEPTEALGCDEAPVTDTEKQGHAEATFGSSNSEVTAENSSSSSEGSRDTTVHAGNTADTSEIRMEDEPAKDDDKEEAIEEASGVEANKDEDGQQESIKDNQMSTKGKEEKKESVKVNEGEDELEKAKSEEDKVGDEEVKQDGIQEVDNVEDEEKTKKDKTEEDTKDEAEGSMKDVVATTGDGADEDENTGAKAQENGREGNLDKGDTIAGEETVKEAEQSEKDEDSKVEDSECVKADGEQLEEKVTTAEEIQEGEERSQSIEEQPEKMAEEEQKTECTNMSNENIESKNTDGDNKAEDESNGATTEDDKAEEIKDNVTEIENVQKESEKDGNNCEKDERDTAGTEVDAENGEKEIATVGQKETQEDEARSTPQDKKDMEGEYFNEPNTVLETMTEELNKMETGESAKDHGETSDQCENDKLDQSSDTDRVEKKSKTEDTNGDIQFESHHGESEPATSVVNSKEEAKADNSELKEDVNYNKTEESKDPDENIEPTDSKESAPESEDKDSDVNIKKDDVQNNVNEVTVVSSASQAQSSEPTANVDNAAHKSDGEKEESNAPPSDSEMDKPPNTDTNAADVDPSAVNGETGADTEGASKPSEEGASVVLKPQAESDQDADAGHPKDSSAEDKEADIPVKSDVTPESLEREDNRDLVKNWVNLHQESKFFETFVEPLDDLKGSTLNGTANDSNHNIELIESKNATEQPRPESPAITLKMSEHKADDGIIVKNAEKDADPITNDLNESEDNTKVVAIQSDLRSYHSKDDDRSESEPTKETLQVKETEVTDFTPITETEHSGEEDTTRSAKEEASSEEHNGTSRRSEEDKDKDATIEKEPEQNEISKTEVESVVDTNHSVASVQPDNVPESTKEEEATKDRPGLNKKQTVDENKDHMSPSKTEDEPQEHEENLSKSSPTDMTAGEPVDIDTSEQKEESTDVTEITDLTTTSKSDDGRQGDTQGVQLQPKQSEGSVNGDNKVECIEDIKHTVSKDQLSTFSVEETTLFDRTSYPPLTTARTESGY